MRWMALVMLGVMAVWGVNSAVGAEVRGRQELMVVVERLGNAKYEERERAQETLENWPVERIGEVVEVEESAKDPEVKERMHRALEKLGQRFLKEGGARGVDRSSWPAVHGKLVDDAGKDDQHQDQHRHD